MKEVSAASTALASVMYLPLYWLQPDDLAFQSFD
jgi:hypothetical protein